MVAKEDMTYEERKELINLKHDLRMKELLYIRESEAIRHENNLSLHRIKRADQKRIIAERENFRN